MRTRLSCKPWLEEVSHKGVTVSPGQWYSPPLCGVETASLEAAVDTRTLLKQTGQWDRNDICSCCERRGQNVPCLWFEASKFLALVTPVLTFHLTFMPVARKKNVLFQFFSGGGLILSKQVFGFKMSKVVTYWGCCILFFFFIFSYLSFAVHLPLLHEYRTIFRLTFSSAWRNRRWWKFMESRNLSKNNSSVGTALGSASSRKKSPHRTRPLPLTASAVPKCNWNIMCQTGYHSGHYAALKGALHWPFRQRMHAGDRSGLNRSGSYFLFFGCRIRVSLSHWSFLCFQFAMFGNGKTHQRSLFLLRQLHANVDAEIFLCFRSTFKQILQLKKKTKPCHAPCTRCIRPLGCRRPSGASHPGGVALRWAQML